MQIYMNKCVYRIQDLFEENLFVALRFDNRYKSLENISCSTLPPLPYLYKETRYICRSYD